MYILSDLTDSLGLTISEIPMVSTETMYKHFITVVHTTFFFSITKKINFRFHIIKQAKINVSPPESPSPLYRNKITEAQGLSIIP